MTDGRLSFIAKNASKTEDNRRLITQNIDITHYRMNTWKDKIQVQGMQIGHKRTEQKNK